MCLQTYGVQVWSVLPVSCGLRVVVTEYPLRYKDGLSKWWMELVKSRLLLIGVSKGAGFSVFVQIS